MGALDSDAQQSTNVDIEYELMDKDSNEMVAQMKHIRVIIPYPTPRESKPRMCLGQERKDYIKKQEFLIQPRRSKAQRCLW